MKLVYKWYRSWSFWLALLAAGLSALEVSLPLFSSVLPAGKFAIASAAVGILAAIARTIQQKSMHDEKPD